MIEWESPEAKASEFIKSFVSVIEETSPDGIPTFEDFSTNPFMPFWRYCIITSYEEELDDFRFTFFGSDVVVGHDRDLSKKLLSESNFLETESIIREMNSRCIDESLRIYSSGKIDFMNLDFHRWHHVKVPLRRKGSINETLTCIEYIPLSAAVFPS